MNIPHNALEEQRRDHFYTLDHCAICGDILDFPGDYICIDCKAGDYK